MKIDEVKSSIQKFAEAKKVTILEGTHGIQTKIYEKLSKSVLFNKINEESELEPHIEKAYEEVGDDIVAASNKEILSQIKGENPEEYKQLTEMLAAKGVNIQEMEGEGEEGQKPEEVELTNESLIKALDDLKVGMEYQTPSGMGGSFKVKYTGLKDGKHEFTNVTKGYSGTKYSYNDADVMKNIHTGSVSEEENQDLVNEAANDEVLAAIKKELEGDDKITKESIKAAINDHMKDASIGDKQAALTKLSGMLLEEADNTDDVKFEEETPEGEGDKGDRMELSENFAIPSVADFLAEHKAKKINEAVKVSDYDHSIIVSPGSIDSAVDLLKKNDVKFELNTNILCFDKKESYDSAKTLLKKAELIKEADGDQKISSISQLKNALDGSNAKFYERTSFSGTVTIGDKSWTYDEKKSDESSKYQSIFDYALKKGLIKEADGDQFGDEIKLIDTWFDANKGEADDYEWDGKTLKLLDKDKGEIKSLTREELSKEIEGLPAEQSVNEAAWAKDWGIKTDEVGKFWVVTRASGRSTLQDIRFESDITYFANQVRGGLDEKDVIGFYKTEASATKKAQELLDKQ